MTSSIKRKDTPETTVIVKNYATRLSMKNVNIFTQMTSSNYIEQSRFMIAEVFAFFLLPL